ncbi:TIR domain-containing protein [Cochleicola gelatinilyticus]|uniref:Nucleoside 2-deoxyribosyltransferase n=1 Tax=Cochleicola gelatinilyticus TaxID=1763537 RepID=A0A167HSP3_9FLAO|nr:hypothetical protein [Cochleicola gelatinilyticus]OAB78923.1 hypothetical protein ULVI_10120 [Cochleicola gelatinilyticus]
MEGIKVSIVNKDAFTVNADILGMKYATQAHGLDHHVIEALEAKGLHISKDLPVLGNFHFMESHEVVAAPHLLFIGTPPLQELNYKEIRAFGTQMMSAAKESNNAAKTLLLTIHGPGYGLDEVESFKSQLAGITEAIENNLYPESLEEIIFSELSLSRSGRLRENLYRIFSDGLIPKPNSRKIDTRKAVASLMESTGKISEEKKRVFVAMPFAEDFDDIFHYGIQGAVNNAGYLCERADLESFTGDIMSWVLQRIESAELVIADLSLANPNVYLEVGYAWGKGKKTVLIINDSNELKFDTRGQRCLPYKRIKDLERVLTNELKNLSRM